MNSLLDNIERVPIGSILPYPRNPRRGDIDAIKSSLEEIKQYRPVVVQTSTRYVIAGNHTYHAAVELGWEEIDVVLVDVDDTTAKRILVVDNRLPDLGDYDEALLGAILSEIADEDLDLLEGTGYSPEDVEALLQSTILVDLSNEDAGEGVGTAAAVLDRIMPNEDDEEPEEKGHPFGAPSRNTIGETQTEFVIFRFGELRAKVPRAAYEAFLKDLLKEYNNDLGAAAIRAAVQMGLEETDVDEAVAQGAERWL